MDIFNLYTSYIIDKQQETRTLLIFQMIDIADTVSLYSNGELIEEQTGRRTTFVVQDGTTYTYKATLIGYKHFEGIITISQPTTTINLASQVTYNTLTIDTQGIFGYGKVSINNTTTLNLPVGYRCVQYIEGNSESYINTNYNLKATDKVTAKFKINYMRNGYDAIFGCCGDYGEYGQSNYVVYTNYEWMNTFAYGRSGDTTAGETNEGDNTYTIVASNNTCTITNNTNNSNSIITTSGQLEDSTYPCYIFTTNNAGNADTCGNLRLYYLKIEDSNNNLIHEYFPCLNDNNKPGLYDAVTGNFLANANEFASNDFSYGDITDNTFYDEIYSKDIYLDSDTLKVYADPNTTIKYDVVLLNYKHYINEILLDSNKTVTIAPQTVSISLNTEENTEFTLAYQGSVFDSGWGDNFTSRVVKYDYIDYTARFYHSVTVGDRIYCNGDKVINIATPATKTLTFNAPVTTDPYGGSSGTNIKAWIDGTTDLVLDVTLEQTEPVSVRVLDNGNIYYEVIICGYKKYTDTVTLDQDKTININPTMYQLTFTANPGLDLTLEIDGESFMPSLNNDVIFQVVEYDTVNYSAYDFSTGESYSGSVYVTQNETINVGPQPVNLTIVTNNANSIVTITNRNQSIIQTGSTTVFSVYTNSNIQYVIQTQGYVTIIDNTTIAQATTLTFTLDVETNGIWDMQYPFNDSSIQSYINQIITNGNNDWEINNNLYAITNANPQDDGNYYTNFSFVTPANATNYLIQTIGYISSEENWDFGAIYCGTQIYQPSKYDIEQGNTDGNGQYLLRGSGLLPIQSSQMLLLPGETYYLSLAYSKDSGNSSGEDKLIIKEINLVEDIPDNINDCDYVDYIQATGSQYIDTGIYPDDTTVVKAKFIYENQSGGTFIGYNIGDEENSFRFFVTVPTYLDYGSGAGWNRIVTWFIDSTTSIYEVEFGNRYIKDLVNDTTIISDTQVSFAEKTYTINLFDSTDYGKIYYLQIYKQGNLVRNLLPVYNRVKRQYKMYDTVSQTFFNNDGTGNFNGGND